jgi:hypothetical protein
MEVDKKYLCLNKQQIFNPLLSIVAVALLAVSTANYIDNKKRIVIEEKFINEAAAFIDMQTKRLKKITAREEYSDKLFMTGQFDKEASERMALLAELTGYKFKEEQSELGEAEKGVLQNNKESNR